MRKSDVVVECLFCDGTGLFHSTSLPPEIGKICWDCNGSGRMLVPEAGFKRRKDLAPFNGRKRRDGVKKVIGIASAGMVWWESSYEYFFQKTRLPLPPTTVEQLTLAKEEARKRALLKGQQ